MLPEQFRSKKITIRPDESKSLQELVDAAISGGCTRIILEGSFKPQSDHQFCLLRVSRSIELIGKSNTIIDGQNKTTHLIYVEDNATLKVSGVTFTGGNTFDQSAQQSSLNHPSKRINIFRYLDGGAITMGVGSMVELNNCVFESNVSAVCGGAISNLGGYLRVSNCVFEGNACGDTGAAIDNLARGSLAIVRSSRFIANQANQLGNGDFGAITAFPDTFLIVINCDFTDEPATAIDYPNQKGRQSHHFIENCLFNPQNPEAVVINPHSNKGTRKEILQRFASLLIKKPHLIKLEGIPTVSEDVMSKHSEIFKIESSV